MGKEYVGAGEIAGCERPSILAVQKPNCKELARPFLIELTALLPPAQTAVRGMKDRSLIRR